LPSSRERSLPTGTWATFRQNRALLIKRARKLERMGPATQIETGKWIVSPKGRALESFVLGVGVAQIPKSTFEVELLPAHVLYFDGSR
jgi:hypothetical protein